MKNKEDYQYIGHGHVWRHVQDRARDTVIQVFAKISLFDWFEPYTAPQEGSQFGSGFFISEEGHLLTNYHVVDQATAVVIQIPSLGREQFDVQIVGVHPDMDIALLQLSAPDLVRVRDYLGGVPYLELGDSDGVYRTQEILALGYPLGQQGLKSTQGIVSGREKIRMLSYLQMTAALNPGSSGGPSLDETGKVIGINFAGVMLAQNVGYVIPINEIKSAIRDLFHTSFLRRPMLGGIFSISSKDMVEYLGNPGEGGFYIAKIFPNSLLERASIIEGDMIYEINGYVLDRFGEVSVPWSEDKISLFDLLNRFNINEEVCFVIYRGGVRMELKFSLKLSAPLPIRVKYSQYEKIDYEIIGGMVVMELALNHAQLLSEQDASFMKYFSIENQRKARLLITNILHDSQAQRTRALSIGDLISQLNGKRINTLDDFRQTILESKDTGYITIKTDQKIFTVLSLTKVLAQESSLAARYFYQVSDLVAQLEK